MTQHHPMRILPLALGLGLAALGLGCALMFSHTAHSAEKPLQAGDTITMLMGCKTPEAALDFGSVVDTRPKDAPDILRSLLLAGECVMLPPSTLRPGDTTLREKVGHKAKTDVWRATVDTHTWFLPLDSSDVES